jgi:hypothetical protein
LAAFFFILVLALERDFVAAVFFLTGIDTSFRFVAAGQASETFWSADLRLYLRAHYKNVPVPNQYNRGSFIKKFYNRKNVGDALPFTGLKWRSPISELEVRHNPFYDD